MFANSWRHTRTHLSIIRFDYPIWWIMSQPVLDYILLIAENDFPFQLGLFCLLRIFMVHMLLVSFKDGLYLIMNHISYHYVLYLTMNQSLPLWAILPCLGRAQQLQKPHSEINEMKENWIIQPEDWYVSYSYFAHIRSLVHHIL